LHIAGLSRMENAGYAPPQGSGRNAISSAGTNRDFIQCGDYLLF
jgi:hypothetical protein